jgi:MYXO-CTERM domain-containing protein
VHDPQVRTILQRATSASLGVAILLAAARANAADWYADPAAAAGGDGSQPKPFATIAAAIAVMSRGDTLWLASGTFDEVVSLTTHLPGTTGRTTIRALPGAKPIIDGTSGSSAAGFVVQTEVPDTTFQGLTIENAVNGALGIQFYHADGGQVIDVTTSKMSSNAVTFYYSSQGLVNGCTLQGNIGGRKTTGTVVTNNEVYGSGAEGIGLYNGSTECTIAHNVVHDNVSVNIYLDSISHSLVDGNLVYETDPANDLEGIEFSDEHYSDLAAPVNSYNTVINNVVVGNNLGIVFWMSDEWPTSDLQNQSGLRYDVIANNTLIDNKGSFRWDASPAHVGTTIENNVVLATAGSSPTYLLDAKSSGGISLDHDLWFAPDLDQPFLWVSAQSDHAGWVTASGQGAGDVLVDPLLVGGAVPPASNAELMSPSPAIDAGIALASVTDDFLGAARPSGSTSDIGAFQYGAVAPADGGAGTGAPLNDAGTGGSGGGAGSAGDGGTGGGSTGSGGGTTSADGGASGSGEASGSSDSGGCRVGSASGSLPWSWAAGVLGIAAVLRRRKRTRA